MIRENKINKILCSILIGIFLLVQVVHSPAVASTPLVESVDIIRVPQDVSDLQTAIYQVPDNGVIEIANGVYPSPSGGFQMNNLGRGFTIRAAPGATVILDGQGQYPIVQMVNDRLSFGRPVIFQNLVVANGRSLRDGLAGGITVVHAEATFINVTFRNNNGSQPVSGGGGTAVAFGSIAFFSNCTWENNVAKNEGAGLLVSEGARVYIHAAKFLGNRTNLPGHRNTAAGGGIHVGNSVLRVSNSYFENNQAGYVGGGLYVIGTWQAPYDVPRADVIVANSTFVNNRAQRDPSVFYPSPTEAGAVHAEDQALLRIYHSQFTHNSSETGGGVNLYRAKVEIYESVFEGNRAFGLGPANGFGGAISAISNDSSTEPVNYPPARLTVENTLIQGRTALVTTTGQVAGGIYSSGDSNRTFGLGSVPKMDTADQNRAQITLRNVIFNDLDVEETTQIKYGYGHGGAILVDHVRLVAENILITKSDAIGTSNSSGGGMAVLRDSWITVSGAAWMYNSTQLFGGAAFVQGSTIELSDCIFAQNTNPRQYGSALFAAQMNAGGDMPGLPAQGVVQNCTFSSNEALPHIFDDDRINGPINDVRYNNNRFYQPAGIDQVVYSNALAMNQSVPNLNELVIIRNDVPDTRKSQIPNQALAVQPKLGKIIAAPSLILPVSSVSNPGSPREAVVGFAWSGSSATLNRAPVSGGVGHISVSSANTFTLDVGGVQFTTAVTMAAQPRATIQSCPSGTSQQLYWNIEEGTFLEAVVDQGISIPSQPSGSIQISLPVKAYSLYAITKEGGVFVTSDPSSTPWTLQESVSLMLQVNDNSTQGVIQLNNNTCDILNWTASSAAPFIRFETSSGQIASSGIVPFIVQPDNLPLGKHLAQIVVDAGEAGSKMTQVEIFIVENIHRVFSPLIPRR
jgi:hypothetical protein